MTGERNGADGAAGPFLFQFKLRKVIPAFLFEWLDGIRATAARSGRIGILVTKRPGMEDADALVILSYRDWLDLHGTAPLAEQAHRQAKRDQAQARRARR